MDTSLIKLLLQLMFGRITPGEFKRLRSAINAGSDNELRHAMQTLWDDLRTPAPVPAESNRRVLDVLDRHTRTRSYHFNWLKIASVIILPLLLTWGPYW